MIIVLGLDSSSKALALKTWPCIGLPVSPSSSYPMCAFVHTEVRGQPQVPFLRSCSPLCSQTGSFPVNGLGVSNQTKGSVRPRAPLRSLQYWDYKHARPQLACFYFLYMDAGVQCFRLHGKHLANSAIHNGSDFFKHHHHHHHHHLMCMTTLPVYMS